MKIGIFSGTFDPFHAGHYEIVNKVLDEKLVDKVVILPTIVKYYRSEKDCLFGNLDKEKIIEKWFVGRTDVILDFSEYHSFSDNDTRRYYHMLSDVIGRYGKDNEYVTILGGDSWNNLETWYNWENLIILTKFIVVVRNGEKLKDIRNPDPMFDTYKRPPLYYTLAWIDKKFADVSATKIRERLVKDMSAMSLGPSTTCLDLYLEEVENYLMTGKTYEEMHKEYLEMEESAKKMVNDYFDNKDGSKMLEEYNSHQKECRINTNKENERLIAHTPIFDVISAKEVERGFRPVHIKSKDWVTIIVECKGKFLMEKQLRHGLSKEFEEFPCGMIESGEVPYEAAMRELKEETGLEFDRFTLKYFGKYAANPAFMTNHMHYFYLKLDDFKTGKTNLDEHEHLKSYWKDKSEAFEDFLKSEGSSLMGCAWMLLMRNDIIIPNNLF